MTTLNKNEINAQFIKNCEDVLECIKNGDCRWSLNDVAALDKRIDNAKECAAFIKQAVADNSITIAVHETSPSMVDHTLYISEAMVAPSHHDLRHAQTSEFLMHITPLIMHFKKVHPNP